MADINWNDWLPTRKNRVIPAIFGGVVVISGIIVGVSNLAYLQGKDLSQGELSTYKAVNGADLPGMTKDLTAINKELRESLKIFDENTTLKAEAISFQTQLAEAAKARAELAATVQALRVTPKAW